MPESPNVNLYSLGKGKLYLAELTDLVPGAFSDIGNAPEVNVGVEVNTLVHYSSQSGLKNKDKEVVLEAGYKVNFSLDEKSKANLARFIMGTVASSRIKALTAVDKEYALRFVSDNPEGPNERWEFRRCKVKPNGDLKLIGDEWMTLPFVAEGLSYATKDAASPYFDVYYSTTTTTTTTTAP